MAPIKIITFLIVVCNVFTFNYGILNIYIGNQEGQLTTNFGGFISSCVDLSFNGAILNANCPNSFGVFTNTSLVLDVNLIALINQTNMSADTEDTKYETEVTLDEGNEIDNGLTREVDIKKVPQQQNDFKLAPRAFYFERIDSLIGNENGELKFNSGNGFISTCFHMKILWGALKALCRTSNGDYDWNSIRLSDELIALVDPTNLAAELEEEEEQIYKSQSTNSNSPYFNFESWIKHFN